MLTAVLFVIGAAIIGMGANRFRGGGLILLPTETRIPDNKRTQVRRIVYAILLGALSFNPWVGLVVFLSCLTGWGYAVSTAIGARGYPLEEEFAPFDEIAEWVTFGHSARSYGVVWLTLHGLVTGGAICAITQTWWALLFGLMGLCFKIAKDWERGEIFYGAVQGVALSLIVIDIYSN